MRAVFRFNNEQNILSVVRKFNHSHRVSFDKQDHPPHRITVETTDDTFDGCYRVESELHVFSTRANGVV